MPSLGLAAALAHLVVTDAVRAEALEGGYTTQATLQRVIRRCFLLAAIVGTGVLAGVIVASERFQRFAPTGLESSDEEQSSNHDDQPGGGVLEYRREPHGGRALDQAQQPAPSGDHG